MLARLLILLDDMRVDLDMGFCSTIGSLIAQALKGRL
jgi:hypothetical protein